MNKIGDMVKWKSMQLEKYMVTFNKTTLCIGCKQYSIKEWRNFSDNEIQDMDVRIGTLEWWNKWKEHIFKTIELCYKD